MKKTLNEAFFWCGSTALVLLTLSSNILADTSTSQKGADESALPAIDKVEPIVAFPGDRIKITGRALDTPKLKVKLGKKKLKLVEQSRTRVVVELHKSARSGSLAIFHKKEKYSAPQDLTVLQAPQLKKVPESMVRGSLVVIKGKNLDEVTSWKLGNTALAAKDSYEKSSSKTVQLEVPADTESGHHLVAIVNGREFSSKKPVIVGDAPIVYSVAYWPKADSKKAQLGSISGTNFEAGAVVRIGKKKAKTLRVRPNEIGFELKRGLPKKKLKVTVSSGPFDSKTYELDGAAQGFILSGKHLDKMLEKEPPELHPSQIEMEIELIENRIFSQIKLEIENPSDSEKKRGETAQMLMEAMKRIRILQGAMCATMAPGSKVKEGNSKMAKRLSEITNTLEYLAEQALPTLWSDIPEKWLNPKGSKKLKIADAARSMNRVVESRRLPEVACRDKFYRNENGRVLKVVELVKKDLEKPFRKAMLTAFSPLVSSVDSKADLEKTLKKVFAPVPKDMRSFWIDLVSSQYDKKTPERTATSAGSSSTFEVAMESSQKSVKKMKIAVLWILSNGVHVQNLSSTLSPNNARLSLENNFPKAFDQLEKDRAVLGYVVAYEDKDKSGGLTQEKKKLNAWKEIAAFGTKNVFVFAKTAPSKSHSIYNRIGGSIKSGFNFVNVELLADCKDGRCKGYDKGKVAPDDSRTVSLTPINVPGCRLPNLD